MKPALLLSLLLLSVSLSAAAEPSESAAEKTMLDRGHYLVEIGSCNDCHTQGFPEAAGKLPSEQWLTGNAVGFQGPCGTSYPANLRLKAQDMTEKEWLTRARQPMLPPMPWSSLREMKDADLIAVYRYIRALGPAGKPAPRAAAPGVAVSTPFVEFTPKHLPKQASR